MPCQAGLGVRKMWAHATIARVAPPTRTRESYTRAEVRRMLEISERRLRSWEKQDLALAREAYTFADLVVLRSLIRLHSGGASPAKIRRAVAALRRN